MKTRFSVGRDPAADVPIVDESVSRRHAELTPVDGGRLFVTDCQSSNGTFLIRGGVIRKISQDTAQPGDQIRFGDVAIDVAALLDAIGARSAPPPQPAPAANNTRLVRCDCGAVRPSTGACPACGQ